MLSDDHDAVHRQFASAQSQRLLDARVKLQSVTFHPVTSEVAILRKLVDVDGGNVRSRFLPTAAPAVAKRQPVEKMLRMGVRSHLRSKKGDPLPLAPRLAKRRRHRHGGSRQQSAVPQKTASSRLHVG